MSGPRGQRQAEAVALRDAGDGAGARRLCKGLLAEHEADPDAAALLAALEVDDGDHAGGRRWSGAALAADPGHALAHYTLGRIHQAEGNLGAAEASYQRALARAPDWAGAYNNLGCVQHMQGRLDLAVMSYRKALSLNPALPQANQNLAAITADPRLADGAVAGYLREIERNPRDADAMQNLGNVYREMGRHAEALAALEAAVAVDPGHAQAQFSRAQQLLLCGDLVPGWDGYEWRWKIPALGNAMPALGRPLWDGSPMPQGTLLLHAEQGIGDTIQFIRFAAQVAARCARVLVQCQPQLAGLLAGVPGVWKTVAAGLPLPTFDAHLPIMSLPRVFRTRLEDISWPGPYLRPDPGRVARWRSRLPGGARRRVGLCWAGRPQYWDDRKRSMALAELAPLAALPGIALVSLQWGAGAAQLREQPRLGVLDFGEEIADFAEMAALTAALDQVISVDTAITHLAGAMDRPAWLLAGFSPDWRWMLEREDSPWYPSVRIFRQRTAGDWPEVVARVAAALA